MLKIKHSIQIWASILKWTVINSFHSSRWVKCHTVQGQMVWCHKWASSRWVINLNNRCLQIINLVIREYLPTTECIPKEIFIHLNINNRLAMNKCLISFMVPKIIIKMAETKALWTNLTTRETGSRQRDNRCKMISTATDPFLLQKATNLILRRTV